MGRLSDKVTIITGADGGQGRVAVDLFAAEGARVVANDLRDPSPELQAIMDKYDRVSYVVGDMTDDETPGALVQAALDEHGKLDVLYNNHGITVGKPFLETEIADYDRVMDCNLRSVFVLSQHAAKPMAAEKSGSIIHVSSVGGLVGFYSMAAYCASKGGVAQLARAMATDLAKHNIRVNAICPGVIDTPMPRRYVNESGWDEEDAMADLAHMHLLDRLGRSEEVVSLALYLASDEASFMTGAVIPIDGGLTTV